MSADTSKDLLQPCPFCGGEADLREANQSFFVQCNEVIAGLLPHRRCYAAMGENYDRDAMPEHMYSTAEDAAAAWNRRRAPVPVIEPCVLRDALEAIAAPSEQKDFGWWTLTARKALGVATPREAEALRATPPPVATPLKDPRECKHETALFKCDGCGLDFHGLKRAEPIGDSVRAVTSPPAPAQEIGPTPLSPNLPSPFV